MESEEHFHSDLRVSGFLRSAFFVCAGGRTPGATGAGPAAGDPGFSAIVGSGADEGTVTDLEQPGQST